jgi:hypothetical protein
MRPHWGRLLRHVLTSGIALAVIGHLFARAFLFVYRVQSGGAYVPENERVLWQTPLVMATFGILLTAGVDLFVIFVRRSAQAPAPDPRPTA